MFLSVWRDTGDEKYKKTGGLSLVVLKAHRKAF